MRCRFYFEKKKFLLIDTSTEEFYLVNGNGICNKSLFLYPSEEGIFLYFEMCSLYMKIHLIRTLIFKIKGKIALFLKIKTSAVNLARILLPRVVLSISFLEQCSRAPSLFPPLLQASSRHPQNLKLFGALPSSSSYCDRGKNKFNS